MWCKAIAVTGVLLAASSAARADLPRPLGEGPVAPATPAAAPDDRVSSPYWNAGQNDLPAADIRAVPPARAQATAAKWAFNQSLDDLSFALRLSQMQYSLRPDVVAAANEERAAYNTMQKERQRALEPLNSNAAYVASNTLSRNVYEQIADERFADVPDTHRLNAMASLRLNYVQDNRKLESSVLERDESYQKARQRYLDASHTVADLRQAESLAVMTSNDLKTLRRQVAAARIAKLTTAAYRDSLIEARDIALDYAGYNRGIDRYHGNYIDSLYGGVYGGYSVGFGRY